MFADLKRDTWEETGKILLNFLLFISLNVKEKHVSSAWDSPETTVIITFKAQGILFFLSDFIEKANGIKVMSYLHAMQKLMQVLFSLQLLFTPIQMTSREIWARSDPQSLSALSSTVLLVTAWQ